MRSFVASVGEAVPSTVALTVAVVALMFLIVKRRPV